MAKRPTSEGTVSNDVAREQRKQAERDRHAQVVQEVDKQAAHRASAAQEAETRMGSVQPTPTQREADLMKLGVPVPDKEDDRSGPDIATRMLGPTEHGGGYETRSVLAGGPGPSPDVEQPHEEPLPPPQE